MESYRLGTSDERDIRLAIEEARSTDEPAGVSTGHLIAAIHEIERLRAAIRTALDDLVGRDEINAIDGLRSALGGDMTRRELYPDGEYCFMPNDGQVIEEGKSWYPAHLCLHLSRREQVRVLSLIADHLRSTPVDEDDEDKVLRLGFDGTMERIIEE